MDGNIYHRLLDIRRQKGAGFVVLLDPDKLDREDLEERLQVLRQNGVDALLVGGSMLLHKDFDGFVQRVKGAAGDLPVILFPGSVYQLSAAADALLFLSVLSGRNPAHLIDNQVLAAPVIWQLGLEAISCAYLLVESGQVTSAEFMSHSRPLPRNKPDLALAHALAAQYLGFKLIYLEAGSGAQLTVPEEMISAVSHTVSVPVLVGGGIRSPEQAARKVEAGASFVVVGNHFEGDSPAEAVQAFARAIHQK